MARASCLVTLAAGLALFATVAFGAPVAFVADVRGEARAAAGAKLGMLNAEAVTASVRMRSVTMQKGSRPALLYPAGPIATLLPTFTWDAQAGPSGFTVVVLGPDGKEAWRAMAKDSPVKATAKLAAGTRYSWVLSSDSGPLGTSSFETLPAGAIARAEASRARAKNFPDRVLHAYVLQELGAAQDARQAWAALARERPDLPELALLAR